MNKKFRVSLSTCGKVLWITRSVTQATAANLHVLTMTTAAILRVSPNPSLFCCLPTLHKLCRLEFTVLSKIGYSRLVFVKYRLLHSFPQVSSPEKHDE